MSTFRPDLASEISGIALEVAQELGDAQLITYNHRGDAAITLYCIPARDGVAKDRIWGATRSRELPRTFVIPAQPDAGGSGTMFPPTEDPMPDDYFTDEYGFVYVIRTWKADDIDAVYTFTDCICTNVKTIGIVGQ